MRKFVIGDIHGAYKALMQCLDQAKFDYEKDQLIALGDLCDGWSETPQVVEELLKIKNLILIKGNHDIWLENWLNYGAAPDIWTMQGGQATIDAYLKQPDLMVKHREVFNKAGYYYIDEENNMYTHGGFYRGIDAKTQLPEIFMWDRTLATKAAGEGKDSQFRVHEYKEVYLGHTTVNLFKKLKRNIPHIGGNVILMDTGAGWEGVLSMLCISTGALYQSETVWSLYPEEKGRN